ncbi:GntR family transcriptional regulator [Microbacterium betulae]|uniref:GntR family transcriptional regulator n=1 Tax=Microbacterium betulae TaxID=2981139 RepID=A0AA97I4P0_9MICO|nr:GntR family transcriptional regulator [Microbacterium sp. AB]WOF22801.1 GntR family transcriptional regulator [Microbacterium sp. AB]
MTLRIVLSSGAPPAEQIRDQLRGLIVSGRLLGDARLPSVRQLAKDLAIAPGTVAKAYKALEEEGLLSTRTGAGTRVSRTASATPPAVVEGARRFAQEGVKAGVGVDELVQVLRAVWPG